MTRYKSVNKAKYSKKNIVFVTLLPFFLIINTSFWH